MPCSDALFRLSTAGMVLITLREHTDVIIVLKTSRITHATSPDCCEQPRCQLPSDYDCPVAGVDFPHQFQLMTSYLGILDLD